MRLEVLDTLVNPTCIVAGRAGELLAYREVSPQKFLVVVYRELEQDGFIITAFFTSRIQSLLRRKQIWPSN
jgi:hypothetical protein